MTAGSVGVHGSAGVLSAGELRAVELAGGELSSGELLLGWPEEGERPAECGVGVTSDGVAPGLLRCGITGVGIGALSEGCTV